MLAALASWLFGEATKFSNEYLKFICPVLLARSPPAIVPLLWIMSPCPPTPPPCASGRGHCLHTASSIFPQRKIPPSPRYSDTYQTHLVDWLVYFYSVHTVHTPYSHYRLLLLSSQTMSEEKNTRATM